VDQARLAQTADGFFFLHISSAKSAGKSCGGMMQPALPPPPNAGHVPQKGGGVLNWRMRTQARTHHDQSCSKNTGTQTPASRWGALKSWDGHHRRLEVRGGEGWDGCESKGDKHHACTLQSRAECSIVPLLQPCHCNSSPRAATQTCKRRCVKPVWTRREEGANPFCFA